MVMMKEGYKKSDGRKEERKRSGRKGMKKEEWRRSDGKEVMENK